MKWWALGKVFLAWLVWRPTGWRWAGEALLRAFASEDENVRAAAGILLTRAGAMTLDLVAPTLERGGNVAQLLTLLGDLGDRRASELIRPYLSHRDARIAQAARDSLRAFGQ